MRRLLLAGLLGAGCAFSFQLEDPDAPFVDGAGPGGADAAAGSDAGGPADANPADTLLPPDAMVDAVPCVAGDARVVDPASGHCYTLHLAGLAWQNAQDACVALGPGTHLATIASQEENDVVFSIVGTGRTWMGGSDSAAEGVWVWIDGTAWAYTKWRSGEPGNGGGGVPGEDCLEMASAGAGEWNDNECYVAARYVCERD